MKNHIKTRWRWILWLLPIVILGAFLRWKTRQPEYVLRQFSARELRARQYDLDESLHTGDCGREHLEALHQWQKNKIWPAGPSRMMLREKDYVPSQPLLLWLSCYSNEQHTLECDIDIKGVLGTFGEAYGMGLRGSKPIQLSQAEMQRIQQLIKQFPSGIAPAPKLKMSYSSAIAMAIRGKRVFMIGVPCLNLCARHGK